MTNNTDIKIPEMIPELERGPVWLKEKRKTSRDDYNNLPIPRRGLHLWRYTDPLKFIINRDTAQETAFGESFDVIKQEELTNLTAKHISALITDKAGREIEFFTSDLLPEKVVIKKLSEAVETHSEIVNEYLYKLISSGTGKFEAQNSALWNDGVFVYIPDGITVEKPIHLLHEAGLANSVQFARTLVVVGKNAQVTIVDEYGGGAEKGSKEQSYTNAAVEIYGQQDSRTKYVMLQRQTDASHLYLTHRGEIEQNATVLTIPLSFGGQLSKQNFGVALNGQGADSKMYGLLFGSGRQHYDNHTLHHHKVGKTTSDIDFKVVLKDKSDSAYTGLIRIENNAKTCEAYQENRNLMLNKGCNAETIPELEILNEDVMCSHGATIGPIDPEMVFFLKSRGINEASAVKMIVSGFVNSTIKMVPEDIKERITEYVLTRLETI
ncbi:MAG: Fe-S cluster assembly protein SufD [Calditrichaeota bacterium]|nr:MAG: Fe-S cluster assembly protein SufD [Calditrichota bacterium]